MDSSHYEIERKRNGVLLVRVHSWDAYGVPLPDAVFTFRPGEPQYEQWQKRAVEKDMRLKNTEESTSEKSCS